MSSVAEKIAAYLDQERLKIEDLRKLVGPLFSQASFDDYLSKTAAACDAHVQRLLQEDLAERERQTSAEIFPRIIDEQLPVTTLTWNVNMPVNAYGHMRHTNESSNPPPFRIACPYLGCECLLKSRKEYFEHKQIHVIHEHIIDPKRRDDDILMTPEEEAAFKVKQTSSPVYHHDPNAHVLLSKKHKEQIQAKRRHSEEGKGVVDNDDSVSEMSQSSPKERKELYNYGNLHNVSGVTGVPIRGYVGGDNKPKKKKAEKRSQYSVVFKMNAIQLYDKYVQHGKTNDLQATVAKKFNINQSSICRWVRQRKEIEAAFLTAEQDRMRVTSTFKRKNQELTGQYDDDDLFSPYAVPRQPVYGNSSSSSNYTGAAGYPQGGVMPYPDFLGQQALLQSQVQQSLELNSSQTKESSEGSDEDST